jgi:peptidyl-tRNA hydrolase, PTH1 family
MEMSVILTYNSIMKLVVGLGNPGEKYKNTRHNTGYILIDILASKLGIDWSFDLKYNSEKAIYTTAKGEQYLLLKPQTFMNLSGDAVSRITNFYKILPQEITVIHDDLDLELGRVKTQIGASSAGHRGVEDIIEKLGTKDFKRIRVGIGKPVGTDIAVVDWVTMPFYENEISEIQKIDLSSYLNL